MESKPSRTTLSEKIVTFSVDPGDGNHAHHAAMSPTRWPQGRSPSSRRQLTEQLYAAFIAKDMEMLEINPLIVPRTASALSRRQGLL